jgi:hypothetical protein
VVNLLPGLPHPVAAAIHLASYALVAGFLALNVRLPGMPFVVLGTAANAVTIAANGGVLPASGDALRAAGWSPGTGEFANSAALAAPRLAFLGDNYVTPAWVPLANVFSIGDVLIAAGIVVLVFGLTRRRPRHRAERVAALLAAPLPRPSPGRVTMSPRRPPWPRSSTAHRPAGRV